MGLEQLRKRREKLLYINQVYLGLQVGKKKKIKFLSLPSSPSPRRPRCHPSPPAAFSSTGVEHPSTLPLAAAPAAPHRRDQLSQSPVQSSLSASYRTSASFSLSLLPLIFASTGRVSPADHKPLTAAALLLLAASHRFLGFGEIFVKTLVAFVLSNYPSCWLTR